MIDYVMAKQELRGRDSHKVGNNTYLKRRGNDIALLYHNTDVITWKPNGDIILDSGGWHTPSTKNRINWYGNLIYQHKYQWLLCGTTDSEFYDGIVIHA